MIREGTADILYSFERNETYRTLKFIRSGGVCFANLDSAGQLDGGVLDRLRERGITLRAFDASGAATEMGSVKSTNIILIGYSVGTGLVPFGYDDLRSVLESLGKKAHAETNLRAFEAGYRAGKS
jgi:indolepyruvate ferredoxin oxidoreductase beta subunit